MKKTAKITERFFFFPLLLSLTAPQIYLATHCEGPDPCCMLGTTGLDGNN